MSRKWSHRSGLEIDDFADLEADVFATSRERRRFGASMKFHAN
jgi:hypothetical protein